MKSLEIGSSSDTCKSTNVVSCCTHSLGMCLGIPLGILLSPGSRTVSWVLCGYLGARHPLSPVIEGYSTPRKERKKEKNSRHVVLNYPDSLIPADSHTE